jgi:hypothetical protein
MTKNQPPKEEFSQFEKVVLRNQRYMMLAISTTIRNVGGMSSDYHANKLTDRVKQMEQAWDWIAGPSERL